MKQYNSLDELAKDFKPGEIICSVVYGHKRKGVLIGFIYSLPFKAGGRDEPALIVRDGEALGHIYPQEVISEEEYRKS